MRAHALPEVVAEKTEQDAPLPRKFCRKSVTSPLTLTKVTINQQKEVKEMKEVKEVKGKKS